METTRVSFSIPFGQSAASVAENLERATGVNVISITVTSDWCAELVVSYDPRPVCKVCGKEIHAYGHGKCLKCFLETEEVN